jgi:hypothetical protein
VLIRRSASALGIPEEVVRFHWQAGRRWCWRCRTWVELEGFGSDSFRPDGRRRECLGCDVAYRDRQRGRPSTRGHTPRGPSDTAPPSGATTSAPTCATCLRPAPFTLATGDPVCARCLKARVKERRPR